jgi:hypothetical protein
MAQQEDINNKLIRQISDAFAGVTLGSGLSLPQARQADVCWTPDCKQVKSAPRDDATRNWSEVPLNTLFKHRHELCFLDAAGFRFYIPSFMTSVLHDPEGDVGRTVVPYLLTQGPSGLRTKGLTRMQAVSVAAFLEHMSKLAPELFTPSHTKTLSLLSQWANAGKLNE